MNAGRIEQVGSPDDLYLRPASLFVAGFIGAPPINLVDGEIVDGDFTADSVRLPVDGDAAGKAMLGIRPENLSFGDSGLAGKVSEIEPMSRETLYLVETPLGSVRVLEGAAAERRALGATVRLTFEPSDTLLFDRESDRLIDGVRVQPPR